MIWGPLGCEQGLTCSVSTASLWLLCQESLHEGERRTEATGRESEVRAWFSSRGLQNRPWERGRCGKCQAPPVHACVLGRASRLCLAVLLRLALRPVHERAQSPLHQGPVTSHPTQVVSGSPAPPREGLPAAPSLRSPARRAPSSAEMTGGFWDRADRPLIRA